MVAISELHPVDAGGASAVSVLPLECRGGRLFFRRCPPEGRGGSLVAQGLPRIGGYYFGVAFGGEGE